MGSVCHLGRGFAHFFLSDDVIILLAGIVVRLAVGFHPHSGEGNAPIYGDYEAQRHWMEVTVNLPVWEWYTGSHEANRRDHWLIDYPPLSAIQSLACGALMRLYEPCSMELGTSWGYETATSKMAMRLSVVVFDLIFHLSALLLLTRDWQGERSGNIGRAWLKALALLQPAQIIIDHGHFQYNCVSLGLSLFAAHLVTNRWLLLASAAFTLAFHHKHMAFYFAPAFFSHLLGRCRQSARPILTFAALGSVVLAVTLLCWLLLLLSDRPSLAVANAIRRLFPVHRGIVEDYVANFWCVTSAIFKWSRRVNDSGLAKLAAVASTCAVVPTCFVEARSPSNRGFKQCLTICALAAFLFGYQVHEKNILYACSSITLLLPEDVKFVAHFHAIAASSMLPLVEKDRLNLAHICLLGLFLAVSSFGWKRRVWRCGYYSGSSKFLGILYGKLWFFEASLLGCSLLHALRWAVAYSPSLPHLHDFVICAFTFVHFVLFLVILVLDHAQHERSHLKAH